MSLGNGANFRKCTIARITALSAKQVLSSSVILDNFTQSLIPINFVDPVAPQLWFFLLQSHKNILTTSSQPSLHYFTISTWSVASEFDSQLLQPWPPLLHAPPPPWQARACSGRPVSLPAMSTSARPASPCASLPTSPQLAAASGEYFAFGLLPVCPSRCRWVLYFEIFQ